MFGGNGAASAGSGPLFGGDSSGNMNTAGQTGTTQGNFVFGAPENTTGTGTPSFVFGNPNSSAGTSSLGLERGVTKSIRKTRTGATSRPPAVPLVASMPSASLTANDHVAPTSAGMQSPTGSNGRGNRPRPPSPPSANKSDNGYVVKRRRL